MERGLVIVASTFLMAIWSAGACAGLMFGTDEHLRLIAPVTFQGPSGERLYLARKVTMHCFIGPYSVSDDGFVLAVSGDPRKYYPMPDAQKVKMLQASGYLPNPLPPWELSLFDKLFGNSLWLLIAGFIAYFGAKKRFGNG
jgi:hypothetical protein